MSNGITKRDLFAAMAMQGILANSSGNYGTDIVSNTGDFYETIEAAAVGIADDVLAELEKPQQTGNHEEESE